MSAFSDIQKALDQAKSVIQAVEDQSTSMAQLLCGNLRHVQDWNHESLKTLKRELSQFNAVTGKWKERE